MDTKKILFTPVGTSDPVSSNKGLNIQDGSIIQAIKKVHPDKIYLFFSYDMKQRENNYHIMQNYLELLQKNEFYFEYDFIQTDDQKNEKPQIFDKYYQTFNQYITQILHENTDFEVDLYLNISSGTPAMKSTLFLLASSLNVGQFKNLQNISAIQVDGPHASKNSNSVVFDKTALEYYDANNDRFDHEGVRAYHSATPNISSYLTRRQIIKFIENFDYNGALNLANTVKKTLNPKVIDLLTYGKYRRNLSLNTFFKDTATRSISPELLKPVFTSPKTTLKTPFISRALYEYLLDLRALASNEEHLNFIRGLSPALSMLFHDALQLSYPELSNSDLYKVTNGSYNLFKIPETLPDEQRQKLLEFKKSTLSLFQNKNNKLKELQLTTRGYIYMYYVADNFFTCVIPQKNDSILNILKFLRLIEESSRNIVAHEIVALSPSKISEQAKIKLINYQDTKILTGNALLYRNFKLPDKQLSPKYIFGQIERLCTLIYNDLPDNCFNAYEELNTQIKKELDI